MGDGASSPALPMMATPSPVYQYQGMPQADTGATSGINSIQSGYGPISNNIMQSYLPAFSGSTTAPSGWNPGQTVDVGNAVTGQSAPLFTAGNNLLNYYINQNGFNSPAYQDAAHATTEQIRAGESARGIANTPYGAGLEAEGMGKFNTNWSQNMANIAATAGNAATPMFSAGGKLATGGQTLGESAPVTQMQLATGAMGLPQQGAAIPQMAVGDWLSYLSGGIGATQAQNSAIGMLNDAMNQNYKNQMTQYNSNNAMWSGIGNIAGNLLSFLPFGV